MIYTAIDTFYLTEEQLKNSPSRKDGIDEATETTLRIYGCDLIQESGILLRLYPLVIMTLCWDWVEVKNQEGMQKRKRKGKKAKGEDYWGCLVPRAKKNRLWET